MKFAMRDARTLDLLANASKTRWTIAAFFFHDRGSVIQKSLDGMVQEILHSILDQVPALLAFVTPIFLKISKSQRTNSPEWDIQALREAFLAITQQCRVRLQLCLFIDALDEHMGDNEQLVQLLKDIVTKRDSEFTKLKICIASRSWTVFTQHFGNCPGFAIHDYTATDISTYVESRLSIDHLGSQLSLNQEQLRKISNQVAGKAFGVFIWVRLVMDLVTDDIRDGTPFEAIEDRILSMPEELEDLYRHTVRRIEPKYLHEAYVMLQIAFCSVSPLHLSTFIAVTECNLDDQIRSYKNTLPNLTMDMRRLYSRGGGLLEAVHSPQDGEDVWYVQLIHQTVKHYMQNHQHELREATRFHGSGYIFLLRSVSLDHRRNLDIPAAVRPNGFINANLLQDPSTTLTKEEIAAVRPNVFIYAKLYEESSTTLPKEEIDLYVTLLREIAKFTIEDDILEWCSSNALLSTLVHDSSDDEPDVFGDDTWLFFCIAVAAGLNIYVDNEWEILSRIHSKYVRVCPLRIAATGLNIGRQSDVDNLSMMKSILSAGYDVDTKSRFVEHENIFDLDFYTHPSHFQYFSPLTALLVQQGINPTLGEEVSLQSARILLKAGADPNFLLPPFHRNLILTNDPRPKSVEMHLLEFLRFYTRSSTIPFVKLLVEHGAVFKIYPQSMTLVMVAVLGASHIAATPMGLPACNLFNIHPNRLKYLLQDYFL